jgi:phosphomethylpyrimidine synthase
MHSNVKIIAAVTEEEHTGNVPDNDVIIKVLKTSQLTAHIIDMYKFEDYDSDFVIVKNRAQNKTCIYEAKEKGCTRFDKFCPLIN